MAAIANGTISNILNATLPTGASAGQPGTWTALAASQMKIRLNSTASSASAAGTEITGTGYTAGGSAVTQSSAASASGSNVTLPAMSAGLTWTNSSGSSWSIVSLDITDGSATRAWFGNFTGQPITVSNGGTFQINQNGITVALSLFESTPPSSTVKVCPEEPSQSSRPARMQRSQACTWPGKLSKRSRNPSAHRLRQSVPR